MKTVSIIIPSRLAEIPEKGMLFLDRAVASLRIQAMTPKVDLQIIVGVDAGADAPESVHNLGVEISEASVKGLSASINAAASKIAGEYVGILEDDDLWGPDYLATALRTLDDCGFVSSTQLEIFADRSVRRINDFPTPCTWVMYRETWKLIGGFNEEYTVHQDNEWLGRLNYAKVKRVHLVEATAPTDPTVCVQVRPWLANVARVSKLRRHPSPWPLVTRMFHEGSGMYKIDHTATAQLASTRAYQQLQAKFGDIPW